MPFFVLYLGRVYQFIVYMALLNGVKLNGGVYGMERLIPLFHTMNHANKP